VSIIEKAVGRLGPASGSGVNASPSEAHASVEETQTNSVEKHVERTAASDARVAPTVTTAPVKEKTAVEAVRNTSSSRTVEIDIAQLHKLGMVTPDAVRTSIAEEFRLIKRPLLEKLLAGMKSQSSMQI